MNILVITPAPPNSLTGNRVTAMRWAGLLRQLGHQVSVAQEYDAQRCDLLVALHAIRSGESVARFRRRHPDGPLVLALTGTDLYEEFNHQPHTRQTLEMASRLVVLQPLALNELPEFLRDRTRVIHQSAEPPAKCSPPNKDRFEVCILGHLRPAKDPFRAAKAVQLLPASSRIHLLHAGAALSEEMGRQAKMESATNPRYEWLGELPHWKAMRLLARCRLLVLTSIMEGGANVISEALAAGVPILSSRIPGSIGLLGADFPGYFAPQDTRALATLLELAETDAGFYRTLKEWCGEQAPLVSRAKESQAWKSLLRELREGKR